MRFKIQHSLLQHVLRRRNGYLAIACGSLLLNLVLGIGLISSIGREKIVIVPPNISQTFWVSHSTVAPEYLTEMSHFFTTLRFNITPSIAENQRDMLLRYVSPEYYETLKIQLINESKQMANDHLTSVFYPIDIKIDVKGLQAMVTGDLVATVGSNQIAAKRITIMITYKHNNHRLLVKEFSEVKGENKE